MAKILRFTLAASLQSWGEDAAFDYRTTNALPSKSGIIGIISACMGLAREDPRILELNNDIKIAVRVDNPGSVLMDFNRVQSDEYGYIVSAQGGPRSDGHGGYVTTIAQKKYYLQDARFQIFVYGKDSMVNAVYEALKHPKYLIGLGRKACVPSMPIIPVWVDANNIFTAVRMFTNEDKKYAKNRVAVEMDYSGEEKGTLVRRIYTRRDSVKDLKNRTYGLRKVCSFYVDA